MSGITQEDREAADAMALELLEGGSNFEIAQAFAAHRIAARNAALAEAARMAEDLALAAAHMSHQPNPLPIDTNEGWRRLKDGSKDIADAIRNLTTSTPADSIHTQGKGEE